mmetsp:Transcript_76868/g.207625  ORF Transcript_76868/g.207625 Transcript_76868/m.207625 type:complete len:384 (-) Transcript_76868:554-1705(-)
MQPLPAIRIRKVTVHLPPLLLRSCRTLFFGALKLVLFTLAPLRTRPLEPGALLSSRRLHSCSTTLTTPPRSSTCRPSATSTRACPTPPRPCSKSASPTSRAAAGARARRRGTRRSCWRSLRSCSRATPSSPPTASTAAPSPSWARRSTSSGGSAPSLTPTTPPPSPPPSPPPNLSSRSAALRRAMLWCFCSFSARYSVASTVSVPSVSSRISTCSSSSTTSSMVTTPTSLLFSSSTRAMCECPVWNRRMRAKRPTLALTVGSIRIASSDRSRTRIPASGCTEMRLRTSRMPTTCLPDGRRASLRYTGTRLCPTDSSLFSVSMLSSVSMSSIITSLSGVITSPAFLSARSSVPCMMRTSSSERVPCPRASMACCLVSSLSSARR